MIKLQGSVGPQKKIAGTQAPNKPADVELVSKMLWTNGHKVEISNKITNKLLQAILKAQKAAKSGDTDGIIKPGDKTVKSLSSKYTAEAQRIAKIPKMYDIDFNGKCYRVSQKEYDAQKARTIKILTAYAAKMQESQKQMAAGHEALLKIRHGEQGFLQWAALSLVHVTYNVEYPNSTLKNTAVKAVNAFESAVKMKDFKKINKMMPTAEKAATAWTKEFNRWWKEAYGGEEKLQWWIATGKTTGWLAVGFFLAPATTVAAGGWGGGVLAAGLTGQAKYYVDNLDTIVNGTPGSLIKVAALSNVAAGKEMAKAALTAGIGASVKLYAPNIVRRLMLRYTWMTKPTAEKWAASAMSSISSAIDGIVSEGMQMAADSMVGKGKAAENPKSFQENAAH